MITIDQNNCENTEERTDVPDIYGPFHKYNVVVSKPGNTKFVINPFSW